MPLQPVVSVTEWLPGIVMEGNGGRERGGEGKKVRGRQGRGCEWS